MSLHLPSRTTPSRPVNWLTVTTALEGLGDSMGRTLLPIVAVSVLGVGTATVGILNGLGLSAFLVLSLPLGALADRWSAPQRMMISSTLVRAFACLGAVSVWWTGHLQGAVGITLLFLFALVISVSDVGYTTGVGLLVPRLVGPDHIRSAYGRVQSAGQTGSAIGPMLLSAVLALLAAPLAWLLSGAAYLLSAVAQLPIGSGTHRPAQAARTSVWAQARGGFAHVWAQPTLRRITLANTLKNAAVMAGNTLLPVLALVHLGITPGSFAFVGAVGAVAGIVGAAAAATITRRAGLRATRLAAAGGLIVGAALVLLVSTPGGSLPGQPIIWIGLQSALAGLSASIAVVAGSDLAPKLSAPERLGAVMGTQRMLALGVMPLSALATGFLGTLIGPIATIYVWLAFAIASAVPCLRLGDDPRTEPAA